MPFFLKAGSSVFPAGKPDPLSCLPAPSQHGAGCLCPTLPHYPFGNRAMPQPAEPAKITRGREGFIPTPHTSFTHAQLQRLCLTQTEARSPERCYSAAQLQDGSALPRCSPSAARSARQRDPAGTAPSPGRRTAAIPCGVTTKPSRGGSGPSGAPRWQRERDAERAQSRAGLQGFKASKRYLQVIKRRLVAIVWELPK